MKPFYAPLTWLGNHYHQMYDRISQTPRAGLQTMLAACREVTRTNCWWAVYDAMKWAKPQIEMELDFRDSNLRRALGDQHIPNGWAGIPTHTNG